MTLVTLGDVRDLIERHLPAATRNKSTWQYMTAQLTEAARGGDTVNVAVPLQMVLSMEGVTCKPK